MADIVKRSKSSALVKTPKTTDNLTLSVDYELPDVRNNVSKLLNDEILSDISKKSKALATKKETTEVLKNLKRDKNLKEKVGKLSTAEYNYMNKIMSESLRSYTNDIKNIDAVDLANTINDAEDYIPGGGDIDNLNITKTDTKSKRNFDKVKVTIKDEVIPPILNEIATYVKKESKGLIKARYTDFRVITATNKHQLGNDTLKLNARSITLKPTSIRKYTRLILTAPESFETFGEVALYLQERRNHNITIVRRPSNMSEAQYINYVGEFIISFYKKGFDVTYNLIRLADNYNPLLYLSQMIAGPIYKCRLFITRNHIHDVNIYNKKPKGSNKFLYVNIHETSTDRYDVSVRKNNPINEENQLDLKVSLMAGKETNYTIEELSENLIKSLEEIFKRNWDEELKIGKRKIKTNIIKNMQNLYSILQYKPMKDAYKVILGISEHDYDNEDVLNLNISKVVDYDTFISINKVDGEGIIGSTSVCEFSLSYQLIKLKKYDKRDSETYLSTPEYYEKTGVTDKTKYSERKRVLLKKQGASRNYHSGILGFKLNYNYKGRKHQYIAKTFDEILNDTGFLTISSIKFPETKFKDFL